MADLPGGTVTFLFTDIEGSTALWERDRTAMRAAVNQHLALLRDAIAAHGGVAFKTVGVAVHAGFATAPPALEAAAPEEAWIPPVEEEWVAPSEEWVAPVEEWVPPAEDAVVG